MNKEINIVELFSGIGGFSKGLSDAGFKFNKHYFSEIDKHAIANYKYNFKDAEHIGSVTDVRGDEIERPNIITFGSPCQDFSLAGKRKGMEGQRSSLILHAIRLIGECRPDIFIWENVKGAYSSNNDADYWAIIQTFANIGGYRLEWQLLNTSWFLPQNRERIYLVGHLAESGRDFRGVFPIGETNELYNEVKLTKSSKIASTLNASDNESWVGNFVKTRDTARPMGKGKAQTLDTGCNIGVVITDDIYPNRTRDYTDSCPTIRSKSIDLKVNNIRRLTEIECERLQGFPDRWTMYGDYNGTIREIPKTQRYKLLGNAVTTNVVRAIGERLMY